MQSRMRYLDGIRGVMSIGVILSHFAIIFYPALILIDHQSGNALTKAYASSPFSIVTNGNIAVQYFMVLTGFLVGTSVFHNGKTSWKNVLVKAYRRYVRLLPTVLLSILFTYALMSTGLMFQGQSAQYVYNTELLNHSNAFAPSLPGALYDGFIDTFINGSQYNAPLWAIKYELWGYLIVLVCASILREKRYRRLVYILVGLFLSIVTTSFISFIFGLFIADLYVYRERETTYLSRYYSGLLYARFVPGACLAIGLYFASVPNDYAGLHGWLSILNAWIKPSTIRGLGMAIAFFGMLENKWIHKFFEKRALTYLGDISYVTYAFQWPVMLSAMQYFFLEFHRQGMAYEQAANGAVLLTLPIIFVISIVVSKILSTRLPACLKRKGKQADA